jgi:hypothetical protein
VYIQISVCLLHWLPTVQERPDFRKKYLPSGANPAIQVLCFYLFFFVLIESCFKFSVELVNV